MLRRNSRIHIAILVVVGILVGVGIGELILRVLDISYPNFYRPDPVTGAALSQGAEGWWTKEGRAYIRINSDGLRDRERRKQKPANGFRIAVLGDSYTEALQVALEDTFPSVMEGALRECSWLGERDVEVINFGVSGYGTAQELLRLRHKVWGYDPDIIVLAFLTGNDIRNNLRELENDPQRPYFTYDENRLVLDDSFHRARSFIMSRAPFLYDILDYSRVLQLLNDAKYRFAGWLKQRRLEQLAMAQLGKEVGLDYAVYVEPTDPSWVKAWAVTEKLLIVMRDEVVSKGKRFLLVSLTSPDQVHPDAAVRRRLAEKLGVPDLLYPDRRIRALGEREHISVLTLVPPFVEFAERQHVLLHGFANTTVGGGHWNAQGHRLAGTLIADKICRDFT